MIKTLENSKMAVSFDPVTCSLISLKNKLSGDEYIKIIKKTEVFALSCLDGNNNLSVIKPSEVCRVNTAQNGSLSTMEIEFEVRDIKVKITLALEEDSDKVESYIEIVNNGGLKIAEVLFPRIRGIYLGDTWKDDTIILPHHAGEKTLNPAEEYLKPCFTGMWRAGVKNDGEIHYRELNYCGLASMMWMYYYDDKNGFYLSSYDDDFLVTGLRAEVGGTDDHYMGFAIRKYQTINKGEKWRSKPYIISVNSEDWHYGAKEYRGWIEKQIRMPENPEYLDNEYVLMNMYHFRREGIVYTKFSEIPSLYDTAKEFGINHFFMAGWNRQGFDQSYPEYYPDLELGTSMDLYKGCQYINEQGGVPTFYINARIFDINSDYHETMGKRIALKLHDGRMVKEQYGEYKFTVSCPGDAEWQKYIIDTAYWMAKSYGAKGIYLDQLGSAEPYPCYDQNHTHEDSGSFNRGYMTVLKELNKKLSQLNKDCFLMIENCGDIYSSQIWGNLTWNGEVRDEFFNLYKYTFPEFVQVNMVNPKTTEDVAYRTAQFYKDMERALVLGSVLWVNPVFKFHEGDEELLDYLRKAINFRKEMNPYIISSKFVDTDGISSISGDIKVTRWIASGSELYIIGNNSGSGGYFEIPSKECCMKMSTITEGLIVPTYEKRGDTIRITAPPDRVSYVIIHKS